MRTLVRRNGTRKLVEKRTQLATLRPLRQALLFLGRRHVMTDELFDRIVTRLGKVACPLCLNTRFSVVLRCDFSTGDGCALVGECRHCSAKFDIQNVATFEEMWGQAEHLYCHEPCACGGSTELVFLCNLQTEDCYFAAVCTTCRKGWRVLPAAPERQPL